jgi:hypothetical protein
LKEAHCEIVKSVDSSAIKENLHDATDKEAEADIGAEGLLKNRYETSTRSYIFFVFELSFVICQLGLNEWMRFGEMADPG